MRRVRPLCRTVFLTVALLGAPLLLETPLIGAPSVLAQTRAEIQRAVEELRLVTGLPPKRGQQIRDPHAKAVLDLGREAAPFLVRKLTDPTPTELVYLFRYEVADVALRLLHELYRPATWPFPDDSEAIPEKHHDYRDYVEFVHSPGTRQRLKESWQRYIESK